MSLNGSIEIYPEATYELYSRGERNKDREKDPSKVLVQARKLYEEGFAPRVMAHLSYNPKNGWSIQTREEHISLEDLEEIVAKRQTHRPIIFPVNHDNHFNVSKSC